MALWLGRVILDLRAPPDLRFGIASAPWSDALTPWLEGTLRYYFTGEPLHSLYYPTVGIFFSSLLALFGRIEAISIFFVGACALLFIVSSITLPRSSALALVGTIALCSVPAVFNRTMGASLIGTFLLDFPSFVFLLSGVLLLSASLTDKPTVGMSFCVAFLLLGINAAIRGPMLFGGPLIFVTVHLLYSRKMSLWASPLALILFALPLAFDLLIQRHDMLINNGLSNLYCVVIDSTHTWTTACHSQFLAENPSTSAIFLRFLQFAFSSNGSGLFLHYLSGRFALDSQLISSMPFLCALGCGLIYGFTRAAQEDYSPRTFALKLMPLPILWVVLNVTTPTSITSMNAGEIALLASAFICGVSMLALGGIFREAPLTWICLLTYLSSALFFACIGLPFIGRAAGTYTFFLPLGALASLIEEPLDHEPAEHQAIHKVFAGLCLISVIFLYAGTFSFTTKSKERYLATVYRKQAAIKISDSPEHNLSLYYFGNGHLLYTPHDATPRWSVRTYSRIEPPGIDSNASYKKPVQLVP